MTSRRAGKAAQEQPAEPESTVPEDEQELRQGIERTREQLGETVDQFAAKTDVKARARAKTAELTGRVKGKTAQARTKAADGAAEVRSQVADTTVMARQKAVTTKDQLHTQLAPIWEEAPEPLRHTVTKASASVRRHRMPFAAAAASLVAGYLAFRWWRRR